MTFDEYEKTKRRYGVIIPGSIPHLFIFAFFADLRGMEPDRDYFLRRITEIVAARQEPRP